MRLEFASASTMICDERSVVPCSESAGQLDILVRLVRALASIFLNKCLKM